MYTKARIAGHPIHPMLIAFPVALYTITVIALIVFGANTAQPFWYHVATLANIAGVVMAVVAAAFGFVDFLGLPEQSRARTTGIRHLALNVGALVLFGISAIVLGKNWFGTDSVLAWKGPLVLSILGLLATGAAGFFGWMLVQTHHVGVKPSTYAHAAPRPDEVDDLDELIVPPPTTTVVHTHEVHGVLRH